MFGDRLKELRKERKLNQSEVGDALGLSASAIGMYEQNRRTPDPEILKKIAEYFNVSIDYLLGRTNIADPYIPESYAEKNKAATRDLMQYENFIEHAGEFFMDDRIPEEDKEALFRDISDLFWKFKEKKSKYGRKIKREN